MTERIKVTVDQGDAHHVIIIKDPRENALDHLLYLLRTVKEVEEEKRDD